MNYGEIKSFTEATALGINFFHSVLHIVSVVSLGIHILNLHDTELALLYDVDGHSKATDL